ncbi:hypothetical protein HK100_009664, partial [Physocladia obscura]
MIFSLHLIIQAVLVASQASHCVDNAGSFCITFVPSSTNASLLLATVQTKASGWAGIGFDATEMINGVSVVVGWMPSSTGTGTPVVSERQITADVMPTFIRASPFAAVPAAAVTAMNGTGIAYSFFVLASVFPETGSLNMIYATSTTKPTTPDSPSSTFLQHDNAATFSLALNQSSAVQSNTNASLILTSVCADSFGTFCMTISNPPSSDTPTANTTTPQSFFLVTVTSLLYNGWIGVAFGTKTMSGGVPAYVGWLNSVNSTIVSERKVSAEVMPVFVEAGMTVSTTPAQILAGIEAAAAVGSSSSSLAGFVISFLVPVSGL